MTPMTAVPLNPYVGLEVLVDPASWDPLGLGASAGFYWATYTATNTWKSASPVQAALDALALMKVVNKTASYTLTAADNGTYFVFNSATDVTVTMPNSLPIGWSATFEQEGAGRITFVAASGATIVSYGSVTKTAGQQATVSMIVKANAGSAARATLSGNIAA